MNPSPRSPIARFLLPLSLLANLSALLVGVLAAQEPKPVPVSDEPRHHLVFENDLVRVIDARLPPGDLSLYHVHAKANVPVAIDGGHVMVQALGEQAREADVASGSVSFSPGATHRVGNRGPTPVRFIDVEIDGRAPDLDAASSASVAGVPAGHEVELENDAVRAFRVRMSPESPLPSHAHGAPVMEVVVKGCWAQLDGGDAVRRVEPGDFFWHPQGLVSRRECMQGQVMETVEIEWR